MTLRLGDTLIAGSGANTDLSNLTSQGQNIANWSSNVTNCITEIPQDIKLELNNGTLTLKAGSKVYIPNGVGVFDVVTIANDTPLPTSWNAATTGFIYWRANENNQYYIPLDRCTSGTTAPTATNTQVWYDTTNNLIKRYYNGSLHDSDLSLPIAIVTVNSSGTITSIDQVFNGFGYIGSTVFALTGVKSLCPNGKNNDDTNKSNRKIQNNIAITTFQNGITIPNAKLIYRPNTVGDVDLFYVDGWDFNNKTGFIEVGGVPTNEGSIIILGNISINSGAVTKLITKTPFHALDWNDSSTISGWSMPSSRYIDLTLGASGSAYTAPANGWFVLDKQTNGTDQRAGFYNSATLVSTNVFVPSNNVIRTFVPAKKGDVVRCNYSADGVTNGFRFVYAEGEN